MPITKRDVADKLAAYLRRELALDSLVDWAEQAMLEGEFDPDSAPELAAAVGRLGLADVRAFGLTWEECEGMFTRLGYKARVEIVSV